MTLGTQMQNTYRKQWVSGTHPTIFQSFSRQDPALDFAGFLRPFRGRVFLVPNDNNNHDSIYI